MLTPPKEFQPRGSVDPGSRKGGGGCAGLDHVRRRVVRVLVAGRHQGRGWRGLPRCAGGGGEGLAAEVVNEGREGAALGDAGQDIEHARAEAIIQHLRARVGDQDSNPPPAARTWVTDRTALAALPMREARMLATSLLSLLRRVMGR